MEEGKRQLDMGIRDLARLLHCGLHIFHLSKHCHGSYLTIILNYNANIDMKGNPEDLIANLSLKSARIRKPVNRKFEVMGAACLKLAD